MVRLNIVLDTAEFLICYFSTAQKVQRGACDVPKMWDRSCRVRRIPELVGSLQNQVDGYQEAVHSVVSQELEHHNREGGDQREVRTDACERVQIQKERGS
jgi:hypothetical protein